MKKLIFVTVVTVAFASFGVDGVWTTRGCQGTTGWTTGSNWQGSNIPQAAGDTATLKTDFNQTNAGNSWGTTMRISLPATADYVDGLFTINMLSGYYHFDLQGSGWANNQYSFGDMTDYKGQVTVSGNATLKVPALADDATNVVHNLNANKSSTIAVEGGVTKLGKFSGVGTLSKTGAGELAFEGVSAAMGVTVAVKEGRLTLGGHPAVADTAPVSGAALWIDASKTDSMTFDANSTVSAIADARGGDYPVATRYRGENARLVDFADKKLLNCGAFYNNSIYDLAEQAKYGNASTFKIPSEIADVQSFFVVYRYNKDVGGTDVFPIEDKGGYVLRPGTTDGGKVKDGSYADGTGTPLFRYVQYGADYQCYSPHKLVSGDLRRDGEAIPYDTAPRGYGENLDLISATVSDGGFYSGGALPNVGLQTLAGNNNSGSCGGLQIAEVIAYTNRLSAAEQRRNIAYLNAKWMKHVGVYDWDLGVLTPAGGEVYVPEGQVAYVKNLDLRSAPLVKTGPGKLAVRYVKGSNKVRVEGGEFAILPPLVPDVETPDPVPAYGKTAHLDANAAGAFTFAPDSETAIAAWNSAHARLNYSAGMTSSAGTAGDGNPTVTTDARGMKWVDFGTASWMYFRKGTADSSEALGNNTFYEFFAVVKKRAGSTHNPNVFGTYSQYNRFCPAGTTTLLAANPYGNPASDGNGAYYQTYATAQWALNGKWVDPRADGCADDEVSVIRVSTPDATYFNSIGSCYNSGKGGCLVGEIICYDRRLTDRERVATERYLLKKWKGEDAEHPDFRTDETAAVSNIEYVGGESVVLDAGVDMTVGNLSAEATAFEKTGAGALSVGVLPAGVTSLSVADGSLSVGAYSRKASEEVKAAMNTLSTCFHMDASDLSSVTLSGANGDKISALADVDGRELSFTPYDGQSGKALPPTLIANYQNGLPAIDMGQQTTSVGTGSILALPAQKSLKSFYMVYKRYPGVYTTIAGPSGSNSEWKSGGSEAIFHSDAGGNYCTHCSLSIDGQAVGNTDGGYPEGMHVFGMRNKNYDWACWGFYRVGGIYNSMGGMYICEIIGGTADARSAACAAAGQTIEQYLYDKWIAPKHISYGSLNVGASASLTVAGNLTLPAAAMLTVGVGPDGKIGTVEAEGEVLLASTGTVTLTVPSGVKPKPGVYPIISGATLAADTAEKIKNWTLNAPNVKCRTFALKVVDGAICLDVRQTGMMIIVQ